jgi:DNA-binding LacI/PurR family transcriptional regulator
LIKLGWRVERAEVEEMDGIGLALAASSLDDGFVTALVHALADPLIESGRNLVTAVVRDDADEERIYRQWADVGGIAAVALLGVRGGDPRVPLLQRLGFSLAAVVDAPTRVDVPTVVVDINASMIALKEFLATRRHSRIVYVASEDGGELTASRAMAVDSAELEHEFQLIRADDSADSAIATGLSALDEGPATLVFDSDRQAVGAFHAARARGLRVPEDVAIVSRTSSILCQSASRAITAINRRGGEIGALLGEQVLCAIAGKPPARVWAPEPFVVAGETA